MLAHEAVRVPAAAADERARLSIKIRRSWGQPIRPTDLHPSLPWTQYPWYFLWSPLGTAVGTREYPSLPFGSLPHYRGTVQPQYSQRTLACPGPRGSG
jgi:hypothetical protein